MLSNDDGQASNKRKKRKDRDEEVDIRPRPKRVERTGGGSSSGAGRTEGLQVSRHTTQQDSSGLNPAIIDTPPNHTSTCPAQSSTPGELEYSGNKAGVYERIVGELSKDPKIAALISEVLSQDKVTIRTDSGDDTRYDRTRRTIYVGAKKKNKGEIAAAILFELNNAKNPHTYTNAAEANLLAMGEASKEPTGVDYIRVAKEMERDEYLSLREYANQVTNLSSAVKLSEKDRKQLRENFEALKSDGDDTLELSYTKFVDQNRRSGHTLQLAQAQQVNFTGGLSPFPEVPYAYTDAANYDAYMAGGLRPRVRSTVEKTLAYQKERGVVDPPTSEPK